MGPVTLVRGYYPGLARHAAQLGIEPPPPGTVCWAVRYCPGVDRDFPKYPLDDLPACRQQHYHTVAPEEVVWWRAAPNERERGPWRQCTGAELPAIVDAHTVWASSYGPLGQDEGPRPWAMIEIARPDPEPWRAE